MDQTEKTKIETYQNCFKQFEALYDSNCGQISNMANLSALLYSNFGFWWCGFYLVNNSNQLELGPFQGPVACTLIDYGKGVCGRSWQTNESIIVPDVNKFEGHIACSSESKSEIVLPLVRENMVYGVLDIDSAEFNSFDQIDKKYLEAICRILE
jgi:L-methionine (R)-S-oxide reductase